MTRDPVAFAIQLCLETSRDPEATPAEQEECRAAAQRLRALTPAERVARASGLRSMLTGGSCLVRGRVIAW